ncbi:peroxiredoxin family protein [Heyndrickxia sporothermodurans]
MKSSKLFLMIVIVLIAIIIVINILKPSISSGEKKVKDLPVAESSKKKTNTLDQGVKAPDFELFTLDNTKSKLSDYRGQKIILNFWATWCPPCKAEMPHMEAFYKKNKDKNISLVSVNLTSLEKGKSKITSFVKEYGLTFPIMLDESGKIGVEYQAFAIPTSYIIDEKGIITQKIVGPMDEEMMEKLIGNLK